MTSRSELIQQLSQQGEIIVAMLQLFSTDFATERYAPDKWCALEIACHLADEEAEDFRARLRHILETPDAPMPSISPANWIKDRHYIDRDFSDEIERFRIERQASLLWLRTLNDAPWENAYQHPTVGSVPAGLILVNWVAHDVLHIRQLLSLRYQLLKARSPFPLDYAGEWPGGV